MAEKETMVIGGWDYPWNQGGAKGIHIYENGELVKTILPKANIGSQTYNEATKVLYICEEVTNDETFGPGAGGYIIALRMKDGKLLSRVKTFGCDPTMCAVSGDGKYLLVAHHGNASVDCSDPKDGCPINLYEINEDGSVGAYIDRMNMKNEKGKTQLHSIYSAPGKDYFIVNDCGGDALKTLVIENGKLKETSRIDITAGYNPRYSAFHPSLPIIFGNNERVPELSTYSVDETGKLKFIRNISLLVGDEPPTNNGIIPASDMTIHPSGKFIYTALRKVNRIVVVAIDETGDTKVIQSTDCGGDGTRGMHINKAGDKLYASNHDSGNVAVFAIGEDGCLTKTEESLEIINASNTTVIDGISAAEWPKPFRPAMPGAAKK